MTKEIEALEPCTCAEAWGENPNCAQHGYRTAWALEHYTPEEWQEMVKERDEALSRTTGQGGDVVEAARWERELRRDAKAFRENSIWNEEGDEIRLTKTADRLDAAADFLSTLRAGQATTADALLPRLDAGLIEAAMMGHYGRGNSNIDGVCLTVNDRDWSFRESFKRMWAGVRSELKRRDPTNQGGEDAR